MASAPNVPQSYRRFVKVLVGLSVFSLALCLLLVSFQPSVPSQRRQTAHSIEAARGAIRQLKQSQIAGAASAPILLDNEMLEGMAALANSFVGFGRTDAAVSGDVLTVHVSIALFPGWWLNTSAKIEGKHEGFPEVKVGAGRLTLPIRAGKPVAELARLFLRMKGVRLPPLDVLVRRLNVERNQVLAELSLPRKTGLVDRVVGTRGADVDNVLVAQIYCDLAASQRSKPSAQLAHLVRRAFGNAPVRGAVNFNQAAFVALSFYVVGEQAMALAPLAATKSRSCVRSNETILLAGRADLAKHWTFSAALRAVLGDRSAAALGEWKELADSLPNGSGFSFIDLAADRSGVWVASQGMDERLAIRTAENLANIRDHQLLPRNLLRFREGLSEAEFIDQYGAVGSTEYLALIQRIDLELQNQN